MTIGEQIRHVRKYMGLTQKELGRLSGTSETTIKQYELGKRQPRLEQLQKISHALGGTVSDIFLIDCTDSKFSKEEIPVLEDAIVRASEAIELIVKGKADMAMNKYNTKNKWLI